MWLWGKGFIVTGAREPPNFLARTRKFIHLYGLYGVPGYVCIACGDLEQRHAG